MGLRDNPYVVLHVKSSATQAEIARAFREQVRAHHPDTCAAAANDDALQRVLAAYNVLRDVAKRAEYDRAHPISTQAAGSADADTIHTIPVTVTVTTGGTRTGASFRSGEPPLWIGPVRQHR